MPAVYQLLGFPGTGKYTVARAIVALLEARGEPAALLDNHATSNLVWSLVEADRRFDPEVLGHMNELRRALIEAAAAITGPEHSLVFTNFLQPGGPNTVLEPHRQLARTLDRPMVAVVLHCDPEEVLRRVPNPDRAERMKLVNVDYARTIMERGLNLPDWPELVDLDITGLSPAEAAARVVALADEEAR